MGMLAERIGIILRHPVVASAVRRDGMVPVGCSDFKYTGFNREVFNLAVRIKIKDPQYPKFLSYNPFRNDDIAVSRSEVKVAIAKALLARPDLKGQIPTAGNIQINKLEITDYTDYVPIISAFYLGSARVDINYRLTSGYFRTL